VNLVVTKVPRCVSRNAKTLGLQHFQLPDMAAISGLPDGEFIVHHRTDGILLKQLIFPDKQASSLTKEKAKHAESLNCLSSSPVYCAVNVNRVSKSPQVPCYFDPSFHAGGKLCL
jgi:hypothetical protein